MARETDGRGRPMSQPPRIAREQRIGKSGRRSEARLARRLQGRLQPASGAMAGAKGDVSLPAVLLEAKSTTGGMLPVRHAWLAKIAREARAAGKIPALGITFTTGDGRPLPDGAWVAVPEWLFDEKLRQD
jgi:hypothetical protein